RQRLQPHSTSTAKRRKKYALAAEYRRFYSADILNVVFDCGLQCNKATSVDAKQFASFECPFDQHPPGGNKCPAVPLQAFHDEASTAEKARAEPLLKRDTNAYTFGGRQERILLRNQFPSNLGEPDRYDSSWIRSRKRDTPFTLHGIHEN